VLETGIHRARDVQHNDQIHWWPSVLLDAIPVKFTTQPTADVVLHLPTSWREAIPSFRGGGVLPRERGRRGSHGHLMGSFDEAKDQSQEKRASSSVPTSK